MVVAGPYANGGGHFGSTAILLPKKSPKSRLELQSSIEEGLYSSLKQFISQLLFHYNKLSKEHNLYLYRTSYSNK